MKVKKGKLREWLSNQSLIFVGYEDLGKAHYDLVVNLGKYLLVTHVITDMTDGEIIFVGGNEEFSKCTERDDFDIDVEVLSKDEFWRVYCEETE